MTRFLLYLFELIFGRKLFRQLADIFLKFIAVDFFKIQGKFLHKLQQRQDGHQKIFFFLVAVTQFGREILSVFLTAVFLIELQ